MYYVYIIKSLKDKKLYTGITNSINRRFEEHNRGKKSTPSTLSRGPFKLIYLEEVKNRKKARDREKYFKSGIGREIIREFVLGP